MADTEIPMAQPDKEEYVYDEWPNMPDGTEYDGKGLLALIHAGCNPFWDQWDVNRIIREVEEALNSEVVHFPCVYNGADNCVDVPFSTRAAHKLRRCEI